MECKRELLGRNGSLIPLLAQEEAKASALIACFSACSLYEIQRVTDNQITPGYRAEGEDELDRVHPECAHGLETQDNTVFL